MSARDFETPYVTGDHFGLPRSTLVHRLANIAGKLEAGENCRIDAFATLTGHVKLGDNCHIATGAAIFGGHGFEAGNGVSLSPGAQVFTASIDLDCGLLALHAEAKLERGEQAGPVRVGDYSVIGANSVVLPGVTIGPRTQIGALSLVNRNVPAQSVYFGAPARFHRARPALRYV